MFWALGAIGTGTGLDARTSRDNGAVDGFWGVGRRHCRAEPRTDSERSHGRGSDLELVTTEWGGPLFRSRFSTKIQRYKGKLIALTGELADPLARKLLELTSVKLDGHQIIRSARRLPRQPSPHRGRCRRIPSPFRRNADQTQIQLFGTLFKNSVLDHST